MVTTTHHDSNKKDKVNFRWNIERIEMPDRKKSIQGNWNFALTVKSVDSKENNWWEFGKRRYKSKYGKGRNIASFIYSLLQSRGF